MSATQVLFGFMPTFFHSQLLVTPPKPTTDCTGKTIIVTGANVGLGKEAARHFVRLNAEKVILACRSVDKGEEAKKDIEDTTSRSGVVDVWPLDLGRYESVKAFAERAKTLPRIDSLVENAGISTRKYVRAEDNESTITVNVVSTFLLALLMMPQLGEMKQKHNIVPTVTVVSSELHFVTAFPEQKADSVFGTMNDEKAARMSDRYNVSKLLEVFTCRQIAQQLSQKNIPVTINFVNPGFCHSSLTREFDNMAVAAFKKLLARTTEEGSRTLVHAALSGSETHGKYLHDCKVHPCAPLVEGKDGPKVQKKVYSELVQKLETIQPGVGQILEASKA